MDDLPGMTRQSTHDETAPNNGEIITGERVLLHEQRPNISKRTVEGSRAIVTRRAITVRKTIDVDVTHEELQIEYVAGNGLELIAGESDSIIVRLHAEEIEIVKHVRVVEEVILSKRRVVQTLPITVDLQHEELNVVDTTV